MASPSEPRPTIDLVEDGEVARPGAPNLPRVMDPVVTMGVVQKYIETERKRNRRVVLWISTLFLFAVLFVLVLFISIGMFLYQKSSQAASQVDVISTQALAYVTEVVHISNRVQNLEGKNSEVRSLVSATEKKRAREKELLMSDLERFSQYVEDLNARGSKAVTELESKLREMERALADKDRELQELKKKPEEGGPVRPPALAESGGPVEGRRTSSSEPTEAEEESLDSASIATLFEEALASQEPSPTLARGGGGGEISTVTFPNGDRYEGEFQGGLLSGRGIYYYRHGDRYEGDFKNDMKHGRGLFTFRNGDRYVGDFKNDMKEGKGSLWFQNGDKFVGEFRNDVMTGKGTLIYRNGNKYTGDFKNGLRHGNGILCLHNGDIYKGEFREDIRCGRGVYVFADGAKYIGEFKDDRRHGQGRYVYPGGEEFIGRFKEGKKEGEGLSIYANGKRIKGLWKEDKMVQELP